MTTIYLFNDDSMRVKYKLVGLHEFMKLVLIRTNTTYLFCYWKMVTKDMQFLKCILKMLNINVTVYI